MSDIKKSFLEKEIEFRYAIASYLSYLEY